MSDEKKPYRTEQIGGSTYNFYKGVSYRDETKPTLTCYRKSDKMDKYTLKTEFNFSFADDHQLDLYLDWFIKDRKDKQKVKEDRVAKLRGRKRNKSKVKLTAEWTAVYNGFVKAGERGVPVKWYRTNWGQDVIAFNCDNYGHQIPIEVRKIQGIKVRNETDSMTDYFDTDLLLLEKKDNEELYNMLVTLIAKYEK